MKAIIEINMGNAAFGNNESERLFELRMVTEKLIDNATHIMAANVGDMATAQDSNGNNVAYLEIVDDNIAAARVRLPRPSQETIDKMKDMCYFVEEEE